MTIPFTAKHTFIYFLIARPVQKLFCGESIIGCIIKIAQSFLIEIKLTLKLTSENSPDVRMSTLLEHVNTEVQITENMRCLKQIETILAKENAINLR